MSLCYENLRLMNTLKDSFEFNKVICEQNSNLYMASLDVDSFFTNVLLDETIAICTQGLFESESTVYVLNEKEFTEMLSLTTKESIILFHKEFYSQIDTVAMGSLLGQYWPMYFYAITKRSG